MAERVTVEVAQVRRLAVRLAAFMHRVGRHDPELLAAVSGLLEQGPRREFVSIGEAAAALGVHERTIRRWIANGELPAAKPGGRVLIPATALAMLGQDRAAADTRRDVGGVGVDDGGHEQTERSPGSEPGHADG